MRIRRLGVVWLLMGTLWLGAGGSAAQGLPLSAAKGPPLARAGTQDGPDWPAWLEARGLSLINLVGQIPEEVLHGTILSYGDNSGIVVYEAGIRTGDTVVVKATIYPRVYEVYWAPNHQFTQFGCLGQKPIFDHMGSVVPASVLRVYTGTGLDVTARIQFLYIHNVGTAQPLAGSLRYNRYPVDSYGARQPYPLPMEPDGLHIPSNGGCQIQILGMDYYPLTGVFTVENVPAIGASVIASQTAAFQSYIGPGEVGIFAPLMQQLQNRYPDRHGRILMHVPEGANYFLVKFPPMPGDPFADQSQPGYRNAPRLTGSTYRLSSGAYLSANLTFSAAFPLDPAWRDQDQAPGTEFLPLMWHPNELAPPEHILPEGIAYNACFTQGNCPDDVLEQIHAAVMSLQIVYLSSSQPATPGQWVPLKMAGPAWTRLGGTPAPASDRQQAASSDSSAPAGTAGWQSQGAPTYSVFLPLVSLTSYAAPPGNCPCGWFDAQGQMLYYVASP